MIGGVFVYNPKSEFQLKEEGLMKVTFVRFSINDRQQTAQLVECYRDIFADEPWNEWLQCPECGFYWGKSESDDLVARKFYHFGKPLVDFWPRDQVIVDLEHEIRAQAACWLALDQSKVVGFCWGYPINFGQLAVKLEIALEGDSDNVVAYQDELGVLSAYRGWGIAKTMLVHRLDDFLTQGLEFRRGKNPETPDTFSDIYLVYSKIRI